MTAGATVAAETGSRARTMLVDPDGIPLEVVTSA
jgi:hypothetical protein